MRIVYTGNFRPSFSTENHLASTLEDLGHEVVKLQEDEMSAQDTLRIIEDSDKFTFWFYTRTWGFQDANWLLEKLREKNIPSVSYHLDLYIGIERGNHVANDPFWKTDYCFQPDGSEESLEEFQKLGIKAIFMPPGVLQKECYLAEPDPDKYTHDIAFVGSYNYHPEWTYRQKLIDWLRLVYGNRFKLFGSDGETIRGHDLNRLYASTKIVIGDSLNARRLANGELGLFNRQWYWSDRLPETQGRGGFIIHPFIEGIYHYHPKDTTAYYEFNNFKDLHEKIEHYLKHEQERENLRYSGRIDTEAFNTYTTRLTTMLDVLSFNDSRFQSN